MNEIEIMKLSDTAILPTRNYSTDAGLDIYADDTVTVHKDVTEMIGTGIAINIPEGYEGQIRPRSGKTANTSLRVILGTIDHGFTGEIKVIADCHHKDLYYRVEKGERIAQLIINPVSLPTPKEVDQFRGEYARAGNGFGSSGG